ncbi:MAG TPA: hypothetical protein VIU14_10590 [Mesorhizobium sp.]
MNDMLSASTVPSDLRSTLEAGSKLAPEAPGGLNIEGLSAGAAGELLIGFRNPVPEGKAIVVPFENPAAVVENESARFGAPILLDLGGRVFEALNGWKAATWLSPDLRTTMEHSRCTPGAAPLVIPQWRARAWILAICILKPYLLFPEQIGCQS